jgi:hypothetical protein
MIIAPARKTDDCWSCDDLALARGWNSSARQIGLIRPNRRSLVLRVKRRARRAIFVITGVSVKRNVSAVADFIGATSRPIDCRIKHVCSTLRVPLQPGMRLTAQGGAFADDESNVLCPVRVHSFVKRDRFAFAIRYGARLDFGWSFPLRAEAVRDRPKIFYPMVYQRQGNILVAGGDFRQKHRRDSSHLTVVWG